MMPRPDAARAVRLLGLKLMLLSVSLAAVGSALPAADQSLAEASWGGMKLLHLILGTMGAGASLFFLPQLNGKSLSATVTCGILCAVVGTPVAAWAYAEHLTSGKVLPGPVENLLAMALGVAGVYIIPGVQRLSASFKSNPLGFLDWIFRRGAPPSAPDDKGGQP